MEQFQLFAQPWWVNLLILVPCAAYYFLKKKKPDLIRRTLFAAFIFGIAFGCVEASVVVYLRSALGMPSPGFQSMQVVAWFPAALFSMELFRETATITMLVAVAFLAGRTAWERGALFLWTFATWDLFYYAFLWLAIRWPSSLTTTDVLFLIPVPWYAQVWFPILVSVLTMGAVAAKK